MRLFDGIPELEPGEGGQARFAAEPVPGHERYHVARDPAGDPALLITGVLGRSSERPAPIVLEHLTVQAEVECVIHRSDGTDQRDYCIVVRCRNAERRLQEYFLRSAGAIMGSVSNEPTAKEIGDAIDTLVELFRAMALPPRKSIQGLWAEVFIIWQAQDAAALTRAWHTAPEDRYDFGAGDQRLEVKSTSHRRRIHEFSLEQVRPAAGIRVIVASVFVEPSAAGMSVRDLSDGVRRRIPDDPQLVLDFDRALGVALGSAWRRASESRFDLELAQDSLRFFAAQGIPAVPLPLPAEVTDVRFRADLGGTRPVVAVALVAEGGLFGAAVGDRR